MCFLRAVRGLGERKKGHLHHTPRSSSPNVAQTFWLRELTSSWWQNVTVGVCYVRHSLHWQHRANACLHKCHDRLPLPFHLMSGGNVVGRHRSALGDFNLWSFCICTRSHERVTGFLHSCVLKWCRCATLFLVPTTRVCNAALFQMIADKTNWQRRNRCGRRAAPVCAMRAFSWRRRQL